MYKPNQKLLDTYADILVHFALNQGKGIKKDDTVYVVVNEVAKPLLVSLRRAVMKAGGHTITDYRPDVDPEYNLEKEFYMLANDQQLSFFPKHYMRGLINQTDHAIFIISETDKQALAGVDPKKVMTRGEAFKPYMEWRQKKENLGKFSWTLALYPTEAMAKEAGLNLQQYWNQVIKACFLQEKNPIQKWRSITQQIHNYCKKLTALNIETINVKGPDIDLTLKIGTDRRWLGGSGNNIPSFEIFTSPDWRGTEGWIRFNQPLYRYGNLIKGIELEFKNGRVIKSKATKNEKLLQQMIATPNADKVGEFSLTDKRFSKITKFMAETLFDENIGGANGNTHIALGAAYHDTYNGDKQTVKKMQWKKMGFNSSSVHTDIISTSPRIATATLANGKQKIIYKNGQFVL